MERRNKILRLIHYAVVLLLVIVMIYSGLKILETTVLNPGNNTQPEFVSKTITRDGVDYYPRRDITVMMVTGIDQEGPVEDSGVFTNPGAADVVMLLIFDEKNESWSILQLNRDTMLDIPVLGIGGKQAGTMYGQLALAHTYGSGLEDSCENIKKAVSDFLYGIDIDYYLSMNMDAIAILNDAVGGVTVTVVDDFSDVDASIPMGETTLHGEQALHYIRTRRGVGDQMNISRMERHRAYIDGFLNAMETWRESGESVLSVYEQVAPYLVSDCSFNTLDSMLDRFGDYTWTGVVTPDGKNVRGEEYMEFYAEAEKLDELIINTFYASK